MGKHALIGYTGFVGSNIARQHQFDDLYNTANFNELPGKEYDLVVSAANRAEMWRINQEPEKDRAEIDAYIKGIRQVHIKKLVLISTVGVYKQPNGVDEDTPIDSDGLLPYGINRYYLEQAMADAFDTTIIRLPGLFGPGLKKNVIYDLLNNNNVERIHHAGSYQYYDLGNIWKDIDIALSNKLSVVNLATAPIRTDVLARECFGIADFNNEPEGVQPASFDMHSKHAALYGGRGPYLYDEAQELAAVTAFVGAYREQA